MGGELSRHPDYLLDSLTEQQWLGWRVFAAKFGTPRVRGDVWSSTMAHSAAQPHLRKRLSISDFMPSWGSAPKRATTEQMRDRAKAWAMRANRSNTQPKQ